jgi:hypothetical protein
LYILANNLQWKDNHYPKKFGLIARNITHDAPSKANAITTCLINFFPLVACSSLAHPIDINTPHTIIAIKQNINITVITILVNHANKRGNAVVGVTSVVFDEELERKLIQFPTKGTLVFKDMPPIALQAQRCADHQDSIQF